MGGLLLKLQNFEKVKLIFGHPVVCVVVVLVSFSNQVKENTQDPIFLVICAFIMYPLASTKLPSAFEVLISSTFNFESLNKGLTLSSTL